MASSIESTFAKQVLQYNQRAFYYKPSINRALALSKDLSVIIMHSAFFAFGNIETVHSEIIFIDRCYSDGMEHKLNKGLAQPEAAKSRVIVSYVCNVNRTPRGVFIVYSSIIAINRTNKHKLPFPVRGETHRM